MPFAVALSVTVVLAATWLEVTGMFTTCVHLGTVMEAGVGTAAVLLLLNLTVIGCGAAGASSVTVAVVLLPPFTILGATASDWTPIGRTINSALALEL